MFFKNRNSKDAKVIHVPKPFPVRDETKEFREMFRKFLAHLDEFAFDWPGEGDGSVTTPGAEMMEVRRTMGMIAPAYAVGCAIERLRSVAMGLPDTNLPVSMRNSIVALIFACLWQDGTPSVSSDSQEAQNEELQGPPRSGEEGFGDRQHLRGEGTDARTIQARDEEQG